MCDTPHSVHYSPFLTEHRTIGSGRFSARPTCPLCHGSKRKSLPIGMLGWVSTLARLNGYLALEPSWSTLRYGLHIGRKFYRPCEWALGTNY